MKKCLFLLRAMAITLALAGMCLAAGVKTMAPKINPVPKINQGVVTSPEPVAGTAPDACGSTASQPVPDAVQATVQAPAASPSPDEKSKPGKSTAFKTQKVDLGGSVSLDMVFIQGGTFRMGSSLSGQDIIKRFPGAVSWKEWFASEQPIHDVTLPGFWMGACEVTRAQFARFIQETDYKTDAQKAGEAYGYDLTLGSWKQVKGLRWDNPGFEQDGSHPVTCVSWYDARVFCGWLTQKTGVFFRLPTEAEWEYACRAGAVARYPFGDDEAGLERYAWYGANADSKTHPAGRKQPNNWGLFDMAGDVWEWCQDLYGDYPARGVMDPSGPPWGQKRVVRGGGWGSSAQDCRPARRYGYGSGARLDIVGFRLCFSD